MRSDHKPNPYNDQLRERFFYLWGTLLGMPSQWVDSVWEGRERHGILSATVNDEDLTQRHGESYLPQNALIIWKNDLRFIETHLEFSQAFYLHLFPKEASLGFFSASSQ